MSEIIKFVSTAPTQGFNDEEKQRARNNIGAAKQDNYLIGDVNGEEVTISEEIQAPDVSIEETQYSGQLPLVINTSDNSSIASYSITGNTVQDGVPSPDNPVPVRGVGDFDAETGKYKIPILCSGEDSSKQPISSTIHVDKPLYSGDKISYLDGKRTNKNEVLIFTGGESWRSGFGGFVLTVFKKQGYNSLKCSHYVTSGTVSDKTIYHNSTNAIVIADNTFESLDVFKAFLAEQYANGTPVTVVYSLPEDTTETITLPEIPTFKGTSILTVGTEVQPENVTVVCNGTSDNTTTTNVINGEIKFITNSQDGKVVFPKTVSQAVIYSDGKSLTDIINNIKKDIDNKMSENDIEEMSNSDIDDFFN